MKGDVSVSFVLILSLLISVFPIISESADAGVAQYTGITLYGSAAYPIGLITIDTQTGAGSFVGPFGTQSSVWGLEFDWKSYTMYGVTNDAVNVWTDSKLLGIDLATGVATPLAGLVGSRVDGLAYDAINDKLYGCDDPGDNLVLINRATGVGSVIGPIGYPNLQGLSFNPVDGKLYSVDVGSYYRALVRIEPSTGAGTTVAQITPGWEQIRGLAFDPSGQVLYGAYQPFDGTSTILVTINISTGQITIIGSTGYVGLEGLAFAPARAIDWWPMFHHGLNHTGYSTTTRAPNSNEVLWNYPTGWWVCSSPAVVNNVLYVGSGDWNVYALNASTGALIWNTALNAPVYSSPAFANGKVYVGSGDTYPYTRWIGSTPTLGYWWIGGVYCLNASNGAVLWKVETNYPVESSPAVDNNMVFIGGCNTAASGSVNAYSASTGALVWSVSTGGWVRSSPAVNNGVVFVGSNSTTDVYALNEFTGAVIWSRALGGYVDSSPAVANSMVYVGVCSMSNTVFALNEFTGATIWSYNTGAWVESSPAVFGGVVFVGCDNWYVYAMNASTGALIWQTQTVGMVTSSPAVGDGKVYVGSWNGYGEGATPAPFYCLDASTGAYIWSYNTNSAVFDGSPALLGGVVYVGACDADNNVYAFESSTTVQAYCLTASAYVNVAIALDGLPTGFTTPYTFTSLSKSFVGTHTITVPSTDPSGHPFTNWNTGQTTPTITVSIAGFTYIAYYGSGVTSGLAYTDAPQYLVGATVTLGFRNTGSTNITLPSTAPWVILDALGNPVYYPIALYVLVDVLPGQSKTWTWNQRNNAGVQVPPGTYTFSIQTSAGTFTATFIIIAGKRQLTTDLSTQDMPSLIVVNNSAFQGYFLAYQSWQTGTANNGDIFIAKYDTNWNLLKTVQATNVPSYQDSPSLVLILNGSSYCLVLVYTSAETGSYWHIFAQTYDLNLNYIANSKKQLTGSSPPSSSSDQDLPSIIFDGSQSIYFAYQSFEAGTSYQGDIYLERLNLNLNSLSKVRVTTELSYQDCPSLLYNSDTGTIYVAYVSNQTRNLDIFLRTYDSNLNYLGGPYQLTTDYTTQNRPSLAPVYASPTYPRIQGFQMAYHSSETGTANQRDIFVQDFNLSCASLRKTQITNDQFYSATPSMVPSLIPLGVSWCQGYVAYVSNETGNWDIWLQQLTPAAPLTYSVTVTAYCNTLGVNVAVAIAQNGVPSGFSTPATFSGLTGSQAFTVPVIDGSGHPFKQWSTGSTSPTITVTSAGTYTAYYEQTGYSAEIVAYCYTEGKEIAVAVTQNGVPTGFTTRRTFSGLTGSQAFTVPVIDGSGHPFKQWSTGSTSPTITVTSAGTYTAYYGDITGTVISINPVSISVGIGRNVSIAVNVANVTNLYTWQIHVYYNASCVNCTGASYPSYHIFADKSFAPVTPTLGPNYSVFGASIVGIGRFDGSGTLCLLNFTGLNNGTCPLQFKVEETFLLDSNLNNIPATLKQGSLTVKNAQSTDIDGNGKVDMKDIGLVCHACFTLPGDPFWNSACDVNTDGRIDLKDVASVSRDFGRTG